MISLPLTKQLSFSVFMVHVPSSVIELFLLRRVDKQFSVFSEMYSKSMVGLVQNGNTRFQHLENLLFSWQLLLIAPLLDDIMVAFKRSKYWVIVGSFICAIGSSACTVMLILLLRSNLDPQYVIPVGVLIFPSNYLLFNGPVNSGKKIPHLKCHTKNTDYVF